MADRNGNLFSQLTRLFKSTPIVKRKVKSADTRVARADPANPSSALLLSRTNGAGLNATITGHYGQQDRSGRIQDYNEMDAYSLVNAALDIYADESVAQDANGKSLHINSDNPAIKRTLEELLYNTINAEFNIRPWTRNLCKYGDLSLYIDVSPDYGVINVIPIAVDAVTREEGYDPDDPMAVRFRWVTAGNKVLENWEVAHFRLLGNDAFLPYGSSMIDGARRAWRQIIMVEDAMLVYRISRAVDRRVFYVDVGGVPPDEIDNYMEAAKMNIKSQGVVDRATGKIDQRYAPLSTEEDFWVATRGGDTGTKIDTLPAGTNTAHVEDVEYLRRQLIAALKVPSAYLGYNDSIPGASGLAQVDIRFSRTVNMIQRTIVSELNKIAMVHLFACGFRGDDLTDFELSLSNPSTIAMQQKLELLRLRFEIAGTAPVIGDTPLMSQRWLFRNVLGLNDQEILQLRRERLDDVRTGDALEAAAAVGGGGSPDDAAEDAPAGDDLPADGGDDAGLETASDDHEGQGDVMREGDAPVKVSAALRKTLANRRRNRKDRSSGFPAINPPSGGIPGLREAFDDLFGGTMEEPVESAPRVAVAPVFGAVEHRMLSAMAERCRLPTITASDYAAGTPGRVLAEALSTVAVNAQEHDDVEVFELYDGLDPDGELTT